MLTRYKPIIIDIIHKHLPDCKIYLFGSRARKTDRQGSDVDIALDTGKKIPFDLLLTIKDEIEETTIPVFVDVVDIQSADESFKEEIMKDRIPWTH